MASLGQPFKTLPNPHPTGQELTNHMVNIKDLLFLHHYTSINPLKSTNSYSSQIFIFIFFRFFEKPTRSFSCRGSKMGGLEFPGPGQQGLTVGLVLFHREPSRPGPARWRFVCAEVQKGPADVSPHLHGRFDLSWRASSLLASWWPLSYRDGYCHYYCCLKQL